MRRMYDAVTPQTGLVGYDVVAGYAGGNTPHVWSRAEWDSTTQRYRLPIWVRSNPQGEIQAVTEARKFSAYLDSIGCPHGVTLALDYETAQNQTYLNAFQTEIYSLRHSLVALYGSLSTVVQNHNPSGGYWIADWDNLQDFPAGSIAHQYMNHPNYDASVISDSVVLWDTRPVLPTPEPVIGNEVFSYLGLDAGVSYIPCEGSGSLAKPAGGAKVGPEWMHFAPQAAGTLQIDWIRGGKWVGVSHEAVTPGGRLYIAIPDDDSVSMIRVTSDVKVIAYLVGLQG